MAYDIFIRLPCKYNELGIRILLLLIGINEKPGRSFGTKLAKRGQIGPYAWFFREIFKQSSLFGLIAERITSFAETVSSDFSSSLTNCLLRQL
ncbi:hypothetical protein ED312_03360 [Sinomicrobium pectinilyticum]|uniref:Uncharacterized protein n=1 Tax=Sinomicrobium pectinilyticum TaxID=1084421 RepID=A0A3N0EYS5_SINP1|nr:hypothetical protein ED312_03360 [Sinomicrobium pectinilyticum]